MKYAYLVLFFLYITSQVSASKTVQAANYLSHPVAIDFLDIAGNSHAMMLLNSKKDDKRDVGGWCIEKVRVAIIKSNRGYGGTVEVPTPQTCNNVIVYIHDIKGQMCIDLQEALSRRSTEAPSIERHCFLLADLLKVTSQSSIIANGTNAHIKLFNAQSLGSGATEGVQVNPGATIPFYLNAGSTGEELVIKGNGTGTVSFGNDYANHKTTLIGSKNISGVAVINGNGAATNKSFNAQGQLAIDPLERLDITTPASDWEIKLKVAEEIQS